MVKPVVPFSSERCRLRHSNGCNKSSRDENQKVGHKKNRNVNIKSIRR